MALDGNEYRCRNDENLGLVTRPRQRARTGGRGWKPGEDVALQMTSNRNLPLLLNFTTPQEIAT